MQRAGSTASSRVTRMRMCMCAHDHIIIYLYIYILRAFFIINVTATEESRICTVKDMPGLGAFKHFYLFFFSFGFSLLDFLENGTSFDLYRAPVDFFTFCHFPPPFSIPTVRGRRRRGRKSLNTASFA